MICQGKGLFVNRNTDCYKTESVVPQTVVLDHSRCLNGTVMIHNANIFTPGRPLTWIFKDSVTDDTDVSCFPFHLFLFFVVHNFYAKCRWSWELLCLCAFPIFLQNICLFPVISDCLWKSVAVIFLLAHKEKGHLFVGVFPFLFGGVEGRRCHIPNKNLF